MRSLNRTQPKESIESVLIDLYAQLFSDLDLTDPNLQRQICETAEKFVPTYNEDIWNLAQQIQYEDVWEEVLNFPDLIAIMRYGLCLYLESKASTFVFDENGLKDLRREEKLLQEEIENWRKKLSEPEQQRIEEIQNKIEELEEDKKELLQEFKDCWYINPST